MMTKPDTPAPSGAAPADRLRAAIDTIAPRFESANAIPVQRAAVPADEWAELLAALASREASAPLTDEREQLRAEQAANVMPQIGPLLDAWDGLDNDTACLIRDEAPDLKRALEAINRAMEGAALASPQVAPALTNAEKALRAVLAWAKGYIRTNSRVIDDWRDDMHRIIERAERGLASPAQVVQAPESAVWSGWACQYPGKMPRLYGAREIAELNWDEENGDRLLFLSSSDVAAPVQVDPTESDARQPSGIFSLWNACMFRDECRNKSARLSVMTPTAAPMPTPAAADDARDAARSRFLRDMALNGDEEDFPCIRAADNDSAHWALRGEDADTVVDAAIRAKALSAPAAKPAEVDCHSCLGTGESNYLGEGWPEKPIRCEKCGGTGKAAAKPAEPTLPTQGEQSHD